MKFDLLDHSLSDRFALGQMGQCYEWLMAMFGQAGAGSAYATSASTMAAESAALAQSGATAASVTSAGQAAMAGQAFSAAVPSMLQYTSQGATLLQGVSGYASGNQNAAYLKGAAQQAKMVGAANKNLSDARGRAVLGELRAGIGAQGSTMSGSPMLVYLDSVRNAAIESANEYYQGEIGAAGYKEQARWAKRGGEADLWSGIVGAAAPQLKSLGSRLLG